MSLNVNAFKWNLLQTFSMQALNLGVSIVLARILGPKEFGIIALAMVFISIGQTTMNGGLSDSVLRLKKPTNIDYNSLFYLNFVFALIIYGLFYFSRNVFAKFMKEPVLASIIPLLSLVIIVNSFSIVQSVKLNRELNFKKQFLINVPSTVFSSLFGLYFAFNSYGVYALIYMQIIFALTGTLILWITSDYSPNFKISKASLTQHINYGLPLTLNNLIESVTSNMNTFIIGKYFSVVDLGLFNRAKSLKEISVNNFVNIANKNLLPMYANNSNNLDYLGVLYSKILKIVFLIFIPLTCLTIINAEIIILTLLGNQWLGAIPYLQILMISATFEVSSRSSIAILKVISGSKIILRKESLYNLSYVVAAALSIYFGIYFLLFSVVVINIIKFLSFHISVNSHLKGKITFKYSFVERLILVSIILFSVILIYIDNKFLSLLISSLVIVIPITYFLIFKHKRSQLIDYYKNN